LRVANSLFEDAKRAEGVEEDWKQAEENLMVEKSEGNVLEISKRIFEEEEKLEDLFEDPYESLKDKIIEGKVNW